VDLWPVLAPILTALRSATKGVSKWNVGDGKPRYFMLCFRLLVY